MSACVKGVIYLVCVDSPGLLNRIGPNGPVYARHYLGWCHDGNLEQRLADHRAGRGSRMLAAVNRAGLDWHLARVWSDVDRHFERSLKNRKETPRLCPTCVASGATRSLSLAPAAAPSMEGLAA